MVSDVYAYFFHNSYGSEIDSMCFYASTVDASFSTCIVAQKALCHLTTATIAGTKDKYIFQTNSHSKLMRVKRGSKPKTRLSVIMPATIRIGFLYLVICSFID